MDRLSHGFTYLNGTGEKPMIESHTAYHNGSALEIGTYNGFDPNGREGAKQIDFIFTSNGVYIVSSQISNKEYTNSGKVHVLECNLR